MQIQIVLIFILAVLTVTLVGVAVYLILVLKEFRETIQKANNIIDDVENVTNAVAHPLSIFTAALKGFQAIKSLKNQED